MNEEDILEGKPVVSMDWYDDIDEPIRNIVRLLRDNGFNTTCSCGHEMYIEGDLSADYELQRLHYLLYTYFCENDKRELLNYEIKFELKVDRGVLAYTRFYVDFKEEENKT